MLLSRTASYAYDRSMHIQSTITLKSGNKMPVIGLGTWKLTGSTAKHVVRQALDLGYRLIDTSGDYKNQRQIGEAVRSSTIPRSEIFLSAKVEEYDNAYDKTRAALDELGVDYTDLM